MSSVTRQCTAPKLASSAGRWGRNTLETEGVRYWPVVSHTNHALDAVLAVCDLKLKVACQHAGPQHGARLVAFTSPPPGTCNLEAISGSWTAGDQHAQADWDCPQEEWIHSRAAVREGRCCRSATPRREASHCCGQYCPTCKSPLHDHSSNVTAEVKQQGASDGGAGLA